VVGLTHEEEATGPRPEAKALQEKIRKIDEEIVASRGEDLAAQSTLKKLQSFKSHMQQIWGLQAAGARPPVGSWDAALDLLRQQALAASVRQRQAETRRRELQRQRDELSVELQSIRRKRRRTTLTVSAMLRCTGHRTVRLSYAVPGATWQMRYQLRTERAGGKVTLVVQARVAQGSGEDWNNVTLAVSTANLQRRNLPPKLQKMQVTTHKPAETRKILRRTFEQRRHLEAATLQKSKQEAPAGQPDPGLAQQLTALRKVTVPSDGRWVTVVLERRAPKARHELETVPKLFPFVYSKVALENPFAFTLLPGTVELFVGRTYVGQTEMKLRAPREPFAISLGVENQFQVHRYVKTEKLEGAPGYGSAKKLRHRYVIQVGNWSKRYRKVRVLENVPVSQVRDVEVTLADDSTKPTRWDKTDGIMTWELGLKPRSKRVLTLDYTVHLPKDYMVQGYH
jgi:uncharacterized protein (TIGR02231 family)